MLPDYPKLKNELMEIVFAHMELTQQYKMGLLNEISVTRIFEGHKDFLKRDDGSTDETEIQTLSAQFEVKLTDLEDKPIEDVIKIISPATDEILLQKGKLLLKTINEGVEKIGNIIDNKGKPFTIDSIFELFEKIWIDFDEHGEPLLPTIFSGNKAFEAINKVLPMLETDMDIKQKFSLLIEKKKEEWRARESNRKLVD